MPTTPSSLDHLVTDLVPSLARSLGERFNVFSVMHHGTHEKQLSNVFAWLLGVEGTHELGGTFQKIFVELVNQGLPSESQVPVSDYRVVQEVDLSQDDAEDTDVADIVLSRPGSCIVVENYETSDGHGHDYYRYLAYGRSNQRQGVVVLLCPRHESYRQTDGWEQAVVVTYSDLLERLKEHIAGDATWRGTHLRQHMFINEFIEHFTEVHGMTSNEDRISFIKTMCETGESARYGHRPQKVAAQRFGDLLAQHAMQQFEDGRKMLAEVKKALRSYVRNTLVDQVNAALPGGRIDSVIASWSGQWEWSVNLIRADSQPAVYLTFGPTAVAENAIALEPLTDPDYSKVFVVSSNANADLWVDRIVETDIGLYEVLTGLSPDDARLRDAVLQLIAMDEVPAEGGAR